MPERVRDSLTRDGEGEGRLARIRRTTTSLMEGHRHACPSGIRDDGMDVIPRVPARIHGGMRSRAQRTHRISRLRQAFSGDSIDPRQRLVDLFRVAGATPEVKKARTLLSMLLM